MISFNHSVVLNRIARRILILVMITGVSMLFILDNSYQSYECPLLSFLLLPSIYFPIVINSMASAQPSVSRSPFHLGASVIRSKIGSLRASS